MYMTLDPYQNLITNGGVAELNDINSSVMKGEEYGLEI